MAQQLETQIIERQLMPPPAPRPPNPKVKVLDEDEWSENIEAIIQRDYFPDVPKLQNKLEWLQVAETPCLNFVHDCPKKLAVSKQFRLRLGLQAMKSQDPAQLRQAQLNIQRRRAGFKTPVGSTPGTFRTPAATALRTPGFAETPRATSGFTPGLGVALRCVQ
jgi:protein DGCR14